MAAPSYRSTSSATAGSASQFSMTVVEPSGTAPGDILIAQSYQRISSALYSWPVGWTEIFSERLRAFSVGLAWIRRGTAVPNLRFGLGSASDKRGWTVAIHAISGAANIGNPLDQLDGTEYVTASTLNSFTTWKPPYTPTTEDAETLAMSIVFTTDNNHLRLLSGSEQGFTQRWNKNNTTGNDHSSALATRQLTSPSTPTMPTHEQMHSVPDMWAGAFIAITATPAHTASYLIRALP